MNYVELKSKSIKELKALCKSNRFKYKGYSYHTRKADLIIFIICRNSGNEQRGDPVCEVICDLSKLFETTEEIDERYNEMWMERPHDSEIEYLVSSLRSKYSQSKVIFDNHDDPNNDMIYKANKSKYISQYDSLGKNGEMILYHGTNGDNLMSILSDDFRLISKPVHGCLFGRGIYFTNDIQKAIFYSERGKKTKYVIICIVHIGDIVKGNPDMDIHPKIHDSEKRFDTSVDNIREPKQFIKKKNGTYNILGIITIENYKEPTSDILSKFNGSFVIRNYLPTYIVLYWVPDKYTLLLKHQRTMISLNLCKRLEKVQAAPRDLFGNRLGAGTCNTLLCQTGHTFICVREMRAGHIFCKNDIVRQFISRGKNEFICINSQ